MRVVSFEGCGTGGSEWRALALVGALIGFGGEAVRRLPSGAKGRRTSRSWEGTVKKPYLNHVRSNAKKES